MSNQREILIPDIGDFTSVEVIDILVKPGDKVKQEDPLITLESDKATMDIPSPVAGIIKAVKVKPGDDVTEGTAILLLEETGLHLVRSPCLYPGRPASFLRVGDGHNDFCGEGLDQGIAHKKGISPLMPVSSLEVMLLAALDPES